MPPSSSITTTTATATATATATMMMMMMMRIRATALIVIGVILVSIAVGIAFALSSTAATPSSSSVMHPRISSSSSSALLHRYLNHLHNRIGSLLKFDNFYDFSKPPPSKLLYDAFMFICDNVFDYVIPNYFTPPPLRIMNVANQYQKSQALYAASKLRIADHLAGGKAKSAKELASLTGTNAEHLCRLLKALSSIGFFDLVDAEECVCANSALSEYLRSDHPTSMKAWIEQINEEIYFAWGSLIHSIKTGDEAFKPMFGEQYWEFLESRPEKRNVFARAMLANSRFTNPAVVQDYDFSKFGRVVDVGGGIGSFTEEILRGVKNIHGVIFDLENVIKDTRRVWKEEHPDLISRVEFVEGSFFEKLNLSSVGTIDNAGATAPNAFLLRMILHDWDDDHSIKILQNVRAAMNPERGDRLLIVEASLDENETSSLKLFLDLHMMVSLNGKERSENQFRELFAKSGFEFVSTTKTRSPLSVVEARPI